MGSCQLAEKSRALTGSRSVHVNFIGTKGTGVVNQLLMQVVCWQSNDETISCQRRRNCGGGSKIIGVMMRVKVGFFLVRLVLFDSNSTIEPAESPTFTCHGERTGARAPRGPLRARC